MKHSVSAVNFEKSDAAGDQFKGMDGRLKQRDDAFSHADLESRTADSVQDTNPQ